MAPTKLPDPLKRRHLLEEDLAPARCLALAEAYLEENRLHEALDFLLKAGETERLRALAGDAVAAGDVFLLREIAARTGEEPDADTWQRLAEAAAAGGRERDAHEAQRLAAARAALA